jgi:hypothetical protein
VNKNKTRFPVISPHFVENVEIARLDLQGDILSFHSSKGECVIPTHVSVGDAYIRESGKLKVINQVQTSGARIDLNPNVAIGLFDWLFAIDTNTRECDGSVVSISCSVLADVSLASPTSRRGRMCQDWAAKVVPQPAFVFRNPQINSELIGWRELINRIQKSSAVASGSKVGIVVDSELGKIPSLNRRESPVLGDHHLPDGFELLYASSDVGAEFPHNKLLRICDRIGSRVWGYVSEHPEIIDSIERIESQYIDGSTTLPSTLVCELSGYVIQSDG